MQYIGDFLYVQLMNQIMYWSKSQIIPVLLPCHLLCIYYIQIYTICNNITLDFKLCTFTTVVAVIMSFTEKSTGSCQSEMILHVLWPLF